MGLRLSTEWQVCMECFSEDCDCIGWQLGLVIEGLPTMGFERYCNPLCRCCGKYTVKAGRFN